MSKFTIRATGHKPIVITAISIALLASVPLAQAFTGSELSRHAKLSLPQARVIALKTVKGAVADEELERENGGLRYSFDIRSGRVTHEVGVDALTGKVLENSIEGAHPD